MEDIYHQRTYWQNFTSKANVDVLAADLNPTWDEKTQEYKTQTNIDTESLDIIKSNTDLNYVVDFGAGMGRNFNVLKQHFKHVFAYDTIEMCARLNARNINYDRIIHKWEDIREIAKNGQGLDLIYECTVFQHMPPQDLLHKLISGSYLSKYLYVNTRSYNDMFRINNQGGVNMLKLIESVHSWDIKNISEDITSAGKLMDETHYSMLLKSTKLS